MKLDLPGANPLLANFPKRSAIGHICRWTGMGRSPDVWGKRWGARDNSNVIHLHRHFNLPVHGYLIGQISLVRNIRQEEKSLSPHPHPLHFCLIGGYDSYSSLCTSPRPFSDLLLTQECWHLQITWPRLSWPLACNWVWPMRGTDLRSEWRGERLGTWFPAPLPSAWPWSIEAVFPTVA